AFPQVRQDLREPVIQTLVGEVGGRHLLACPGSHHRVHPLAQITGSSLPESPACPKLRDLPRTTETYVVQRTWEGRPWLLGRPGKALLRDWYSMAGFFGTKPTCRQSSREGNQHAGGSATLPPNDPRTEVLWVQPDNGLHCPGRQYTHAHTCSYSGT